MRTLFLLAALLALPTASASAASFDCKKAASRIEKTICADSELSKADERLAASFADAVAASLSPQALHAEQTEWLHDRDKETDAKKLRELYRVRIEALGNVAAKWRAARQDVKLEQSRTTCLLSPVSEPDTACTVTAFGPVAGDKELTYQLQAYKDGGLQMATGVVVFRPALDRLTPVIAVGDTDAHFEAPDSVDSPFGRLMLLSAHLSGTGNLNAEHLFRRDRADFVEIDVTSWLGDLQKKIPKGWGAWKGIYPDYRKFTASTALWHEGDGNCCPTAGRASIKLGLERDRLVIRDVTIARGEKAATDEH